MANLGKIVDPRAFCNVLWPDVKFYKEQWEVIYSVVENDETFVPAGNMLGKDFVSAFIVLWFFLTRSPCRIVTTSADFNQLRAVLWGEMRRFIQTSKTPLTASKGGPLLINDLYLRKVDTDNGEICGLSYCMGRTAAKGEGMLGHHIAKTGDNIPRTLFVADEASGVDDTAYERAETWADRKLVIGNPYPCENFFKNGVKSGDLLDRNSKNERYLRKVIKIRGCDSPNVRYGLLQQKQGLDPDNRMLIHGVLPFYDYRKRRETWDDIRQCIGLDAEFWEGKDALLFPPTWLNRAEYAADAMSGRTRVAKFIGVDPAEGGDKTSWAVIDENGLIEVISEKTPNTQDIIGKTIALMRRCGVSARNTLFDRGGGGTQLADQLRASGHNVRTVAFGEPLMRETNKRVFNQLAITEEKEDRYAYMNRRAQMYGELRLLLDPSNEIPFGIPAKYTNLRKELSPIPLTYDKEGRLYILPKNKNSVNSTLPTLRELIGHSPDEADALVLAVHGLLHPLKPTIIGAYA